MRIQLTLLDQTRRAIDVVITVDPETPVDDVVAALNQGNRTPLFLGARRLEGPGRVASSGLHNGAILSIGSPALGIHNGKTVELAVVSGAAAGFHVALTKPTTIFGSTPGDIVMIGDPSLESRHFKLMTREGRFFVEDLHSRTGTFIDDQQIQSRQELHIGQTLRAGDSLFELQLPPASDADIHSDDEGSLRFNRPSRIHPPKRTPVIKVPAPPSDAEREPFPWIQIIGPLMFGVGGAVIMQRPQFLLFGLLSPVIAYFTVGSTRKQNKRKAKKAAAEYKAALEKMDHELHNLVHEQSATRRNIYPDPAALGRIATGPSKRLWERRRDDDDFLTLRIGTADQFATVELKTSGIGAEPPLPPILPRTPAVLDLLESGVIGVAAKKPQQRSLARWLATQIITLHSPRDVRIALFTTADAIDDWQWLRWAPHVQPEGLGDEPFAMIASDNLTRDDHIKRLLRILDVRKEAERHDETTGPAIVVIYDGARSLRSTPGIPRLLKEGPAVGIFALAFDEDVNRLPEEGRAEVVMDETRALLHQTGEPPIGDVIIDQVGRPFAEEIARSISPLRDSSPSTVEESLPQSVRLIDLLNVDLNDPDDILRRWAFYKRTTRAMVGVNTDGAFVLDLQKDGPHGLVAGTTGAGKSEFLQTLVASLALVNRPDAMNFVLVDYKGASAFADCAELPHTVGMVTNLDGHLTERALVALDAELKRREHILKSMHAVDVETAWERDPSAAAAAGIPRLMIVIDEFAELVHELPDFVNGLIRIARVGRSLGVHLILATQRPAGVVSQEMRANTGLRIGLRMEDRQDSVEVLEEGNAAYISRATPGRGYARLGGGSSLALFQSARVAGRRKGASEGIAPPQVVNLPWDHLGRPLPVLKTGEGPLGSTTDLYALVASIRKAATRTPIAPLHSPWMDPLPTLFTVPAATPEDQQSGAVFGIEDRPMEQAQPLARYDVVTSSHMLIAGSARSGRSTALRTIAASLARTWSPDQLHLYGLDFGNGALNVLSNFAHCGAVVARNESDRAERLFTRLLGEIERRHQLFEQLGVGDIVEQHERAKPEDRLPFIVVLLDRWEGFVGQFPLDQGSEMPDRVMKLLREGLGVGIRLIITGDRGLLNDRIGSQIERRLVLHLSEREDYRLASINPKNVPEHVPPGRAMHPESALEMQFGLLIEDASANAQALAITGIANTCAVKWPKQRLHQPPFRIDVLPNDIAFSEAVRMLPTKPASALTALIGVGGDDLQPITVDFAEDGPSFVVAGTAKSGRSTALTVMARTLLESGANLVVWCPRSSPLESIGAIDNVLHLAEISPDVKQLQKSLQKPSTVVLIDDVELTSGSPANELITDYLQQRKIAVVIAGQTEELKVELRGVAVAARKSKLALLLSPQSSFDGELIGTRLPRNMTGRMPAGRGVVMHDGEPTMIQVPKLPST